MSYEVNPATSTMIELTQKFSGAVAKKAKDSTRPGRVKQQGNVQKGATDSTDLSDDMLGDMDPDEYKGKDHSADFKQQMQAWREEAERAQHEEKKEEEEEEEDGEPGSPDQQSRQQDGQPEEGEEKPHAPAPVAEKEEKEEEDEGGHTPGIRQADASPLTEEARAELREAAEQRAREQEPVSGPVDIIPGRGEQEAGSHGRHRDDGHSHRDDRQRQDDRERAQREAGEYVKSKDLQEEEQKADKSGFVSLLGFDDGFIIADPRKKAVAADTTEQQAPRRQKARVEIEISEDIAAPLEERYQKAFQDLILAGVKNDAYETLCANLRGFGISVLETCRDNSERVLLLPKGKILADFPGLIPGLTKDVIQTRWGYFPAARVVVLGEEAVLGYDPRVNVPVLYFAFAYDHSMGGENFASERSPAVLANYQSCMNREKGHQFIDSFAAASPVHYFAQTVESYLTPPRDQMDDDVQAAAALCTSEELYDIDRAMFMYLDYLFKKANRGVEIDPYQRTFKFKGIA